MFEKVTISYSYDDLEPILDRETIEVHYSKLLQGYVDRFNQLVNSNPILQNRSIEDILSNADQLPIEIRQNVINQGGGVYNHNLYFEMFSKKPKPKPEGPLYNKITDFFSTFEIFKDEFIDMSSRIFGSGYCWLTITENTDLRLIITANQDTPLRMGMHPIINIDMWEHSYFLKYKNLKMDYLNNIWNIIDWNVIEKRYNSIESKLNV